MVLKLNKYTLWGDVTYVSQKITRLQMYNSSRCVIVSFLFCLMYTQYKNKRRTRTDKILRKAFINANLLISTLCLSS